MPRTTVTFVCRDCGGESIRWVGQCPHCRAWNTLEEFHAPRPGAERRRSAAGPGAPAGAAPARPVPIAEVEVDAAPRLALAWDELNRVLGGGVVTGSVVLEESAQQVGMRARRLGVAASSILMLAETDLDAVVTAVERELPAIAIVDSIQTVRDASVDAAPGSVSQVREAAARLLRVAKASGVPVFLIGHVTKEGAIAGPRVLEHIVDTVLSLEGERGQEFRILRATKNRFGSSEEIGIFTMGEAGMEEVRDPSVVLLGDLRAVPGTVVLAAMEGSRPLLVELQSLVASTQFGLPRRSATGVDLNRLHMIVAVLEKRARLPMGSADVFVNVAGGIRVVEPAADLALALSIAGNLRDQALRPDTVVIGELGLAGEVRRVGRLDRRLQEAARRGFIRAIVPCAATSPPEGMELVGVRDLGEAIEAAYASQGAPPLPIQGPIQG